MTPPLQITTHQKGMLTMLTLPSKWFLSHNDTEQVPQGKPRNRIAALWIACAPRPSRCVLHLTICRSVDDDLAQLSFGPFMSSSIAAVSARSVRTSRAEVASSSSTTDLRANCLDMLRCASQSQLDISQPAAGLPTSTWQCQCAAACNRISGFRLLPNRALNTEFELV